MSSKKLLSRTAVSRVGRGAALFLSGLLAITACSVLYVNAFTGLVKAVGPRL